MGGGGGDDYGARQAQTEASKQRARDALNISFGVAPSAVAPTQDQYMTVLPDVYDDSGTKTPGTSTPDVASYQSALAQYNAQNASAGKNKTARDALYGTVRDNAFNAGQRGLNENKERAARDLKFSLFGQGLNGGSVDIDQNATLGRTYNQGLLDLGAKADAAKTDLASSDESTRLGLLQSIDAGMDQGSALSSALGQLKVNSDRATSSAQGTALGNLFDDAGLLYTKSNAARGRQAGADYYNTNYGARAPSSKTSGGIVSSTG